MLHPNRKKIFEGLTVDDRCADSGCRQYSYVDGKKEHRCSASEDVECPITNNIAAGINDFISKNDWTLSLIVNTES